jgi:phosphohistidine phosphatase
MAPQIWLLRHGEAVPHDSKPDDERELTARGERQSAAAGQALARLGMEFTACYTSPKVRARQTAELACASLNIDPVEVEAVGGGFGRDEALELLYAHTGEDEDPRILVVGHEPDFSQLVYDLTGGRVDFKKGGVAGMKVARTGGELITLLRPRELESLALSGGG